MHVNMGFRIRKSLAGMLIGTLLVALGVAIVALGPAFFTAKWPVVAFMAFAAISIFVAGRHSRKDAAHTAADASLARSLLDNHHDSIANSGETPAMRIDVGHPAQAEDALS